MPRIDRIVAGVSGSPGNLPALRYAADLARACDAALMFVHAWVPAGPEFLAWQFPVDPLVHQWQDDAWQRLWHALDVAFGGLPADIPAEPLITRGIRARSWSARPAGTVPRWSSGPGAVARSAASGTARSPGTAWPMPAAR